MSERPPGVKVGDRVRLTTIHSGIITEIDDYGWRLETSPGRPVRGGFGGDAKMTWELLRPDTLAEASRVDQQWLEASCDHRDPESVDLWRGSRCPTCVAEHAVVDAARTWRGLVRLASETMTATAWTLTPQSAALVAALDALDNAGDSPC